MFKNARVGDKVWSFVDGWGEIIEYKEGNTLDYPMRVKFPEATTLFTVDGRELLSDQHPVLFWDKVEFKIPERPAPALKVDTRVVVWSGDGCEKYKRYFKEFDENGVIICFLNGKTSWTSNGIGEDWSHWELAE